ncbi:hypothetical protein scyTo_0017997 [Scyliorhinus torazame]|uniref:Uncharacterized protein n=1 Tax=Scyliorhinus torazame TaxID=75743 RepID=A0A401Q3V4_SCYTO|nr:hypothetical protein [Scyliorhinus torazame]
MAVAAWTESKAHKRHLEKAVWLVCLSQHVAKTERRVEELEQELGEVRASAGDSASAAERLREELAEVKQGSLQDSESNRYEKEYLHCQIVEGKEKERKVQELYIRSTGNWREGLKILRQYTGWLARRYKRRRKMKSLQRAFGKKRIAAQKRGSLV